VTVVPDRPPARPARTDAPDPRDVRLSINLLAWSATVDRREIDLFPALARLGYAGVEVPILESEVPPASLDAIAAGLGAAGLACTVSTALPRGTSLLDATQAREGVRFLRACIEAAGRLGARIVCGPVYAPVGDLPGRPADAAEWRSCVAALREVGRVAAGAGVTVAAEVLNRFETHFLNTAEQAVRLVEAVSSAHVGVHLDTFHMNVEEKDPAVAIATAGRHLVHFHCSENDRGTVGSGQVPWARVLDALEAIDYDGWLVCETFNGHVPSLAAATAVWRPLVPDPMSYARDSLTYLRAALADRPRTAPPAAGAPEAGEERGRR